MLFMSLFVSGVLLVAVHSAIQRSWRSAFGAAFLGLLFSFAMFLQAVLLQAGLHCLAIPIWQGLLRSIVRFRIVSFFATFIAYLLVFLNVHNKQLELERLKQMFAFESMADRVPFLPSVSDELSIKSNYELDKMEHNIDYSANFIRWISLKRLHESRVQQFVDSPGFGIARMVGPPKEGDMTWGLRNGSAPKQPYVSIIPTDSPSDSLTERPRESDVSFRNLHNDSVYDFVHPRGFGYMKNRDHVAGFQSHGFSGVPKTSGSWQVGQLELVSLLMHPEPRVYVSKSLPRMDELKGVPTRSLDPFENDGLIRLRQGEDLYMRGERMLGSIRSVKQCIDCHGGNRGQLLGAFSYILVREGE